jgi:hypothetical protein
MTNFNLTRNRLKGKLALYSILCFLAFNAKGNAEAKRPTPKLEYHLSWDGHSSVLKVRLNYTPVNADSTVFIFGSDGFGGQTDIFKTVSMITVDPSDKVKRVEATRKIIVHHGKGGLKQLVYEVDGKLKIDPRRAIYNELFRPVINDNNLYMVSFFFMMKPLGQLADKISIQWDARPDGYSYFLSSLGSTDISAKAVIDSAKTEQTAILMGADLSVSNYKVHGIPYFLITSKRDTVNNIKREMDPFFTRYFPSLRDFWKDDDASFYFVSLTPLFSSDKPAGGGFGWGPGFIMKYAGKFDDWKKGVVAHETSHNWIGLKMSIGDSFANQWFGEGFNDYTCMLNLVKSGIFGDTSFLSYVNKKNLQPHYTSPVKNAHNDSIRSKYWVDKNYEKLPYRRGLIYAFYLDNQIQITSGGKYSIRDLLLAMFKVYKDKKAANVDVTLKIKDFIDAAAAYLPREQVEQEVQKYMIHGDPIDFSHVKMMGLFQFTFEGDVPELHLTGDADLKSFCKW